MPKQSPIFRPVCLAVILGLGIQVVVAFVVVLCMGVGDQMLRSDRTHETLTLLVDGTPVIVTHPAGNWSNRTYRTLNGSPVDPADTSNSLWAAQLSGMSPPALFPVRLPWARRIRPFSDGGQPAIYWYYVHDGKQAGSGYFVGFDIQSKHCVGYIGRGGYRSDLPPSEDRLPVGGRRSRYFWSRMASGGDQYYPGQVPAYRPPSADSLRMPNWRVYVASANQLLEVDLRRRCVRTLMEADGILSINIVRRALPSGQEQSDGDRLKLNQDRRYLAVRTDRELIVHDPGSGARRAYPIPPEIGRGSIGLYQLNDETVIVEDMHNADSAVDLYWIPPGGQVARHEHVELQRSRGRFDELDDRVKTGLTGLLVPVPALWTVVTTAIGPLGLITSGRASGYPDALAEALAEGWPALLVSVVLAAVATWFCWRWQRQYAMPWSRTWAAVVLLLGVPALLGYLAHRVWPARVGCPACKAAVPRDRDACPRCDRSFPEPEAKGIEILVY